MQQLDSRIIESVEVHIRGEDDTIKMGGVKGKALMEYLTSDNAGSHVMITDLDGVVITVSKHEIRKIVPYYKQEYDGDLSEIKI